MEPGPVTGEEGDRCFDEGLGTVYERFMLNALLDRLLEAYRPRKVLEVPLFGTTGLTGINSVRLAQRGCEVTLVDDREQALREARRIWAALPCADRCRIMARHDLTALPFPDGCFDLVWNFSALWHAPQAGKLLSEMSRVSARLVLIVTTNTLQPGYLLRKYLLDPAFFKTVDERWNGLPRVRAALTRAGFQPVEQGLLDMPPWPDTCLPLGRFLDRLRPGRERSNGRRLWNWDIVTYYRGGDPLLKQRVEKLAFLERMPLPGRLKACWAHHRYLLCRKA